MSGPAADDALLELRNVSTRFSLPGGGGVHAINGVDLSVRRGEVLGLIGESGSGKSQLFMSVLGLAADNATVTGSATFKGEQLIGMPEKRLSRLRGNRIAIVFQNPLTSLNPYLTVDIQMTEVLTVHEGLSHGEARRRALAMLDLVQIPDARERLGMYPHEFSGGMRQRVLIAMALLCRPELLIADEITTALDVTVQAQILDLLKAIRRDFQMTMVIISHNLGVVAGTADRVAVMYAGRIAELAPVDGLFASPAHPYTEALLEATPRLGGDPGAPMVTMPGRPPDMRRVPPGCAYRPRCRRAFDRCTAERPALLPAGPARFAACHLAGGAP